MLMEKLSKLQSPKNASHSQPKPSAAQQNKNKNAVVPGASESDKPDNFNLNGSFID